MTRTNGRETVSARAAGRVAIVTIDRPERRNAVDLRTAGALYEAFKRFDADEGADVAIVAGAGGYFCAGADLKALAEGEPRRFEPDGDFGPMGPTRLKLAKPVIASVEGPAVAGGLELALWCDLRIAARSATFGVFNRRFGVPLVDLGTIRLPRVIGHGRAMDLILTGRGRRRGGVADRPCQRDRRGRRGPEPGARARGNALRLSAGRDATTACRRSSSGGFANPRRRSTRSRVAWRRSRRARPRPARSASGTAPGGAGWLWRVGAASRGRGFAPALTLDSGAAG